MPKVNSGRFAVVTFLLLLACVALCGGSSRVDSLGQPVVRLAAIGVLAALILRPGHHDRREFRMGFGFLALVAGWIALQLLPLPPGIWTSLPGRARYLAAAAGGPQPWRPINLTPDRGLNALFALLPPTAALAVAARIRPHRQSVMLTALLLVVLASAAIGLAQVSAGEDDMLRFYAAPPTGAAVGLFGNRNHQALLLCCGLPMIATWASSESWSSLDKRVRLAIAAAAGAFLLLMIPTTGSRAGLILAVVALAASIPLAIPAVGRLIRPLPPRERRVVTVAALLILVLVIAAALSFSRAVAVQRLFEGDAIDNARVRLLGPLIEMIREFMPFGSGFGSFDPVYRGFEPFQNLALTFMNQAHDDYLQVAMEGGLPGILLLCIFLVWWGWSSIRLWSGQRSDAVTYGRLGSTLLLLMMLGSIADYPVRTPLMMVFAAQSAAWMLIAARRSNATR